MPAVVRELGALAGLGSIVALAVLSVLYVSHARGVKQLRDWAGGAPEAAPSPARRSRARRRRTLRARALVLAGLLVVSLGTYAVSRMLGGAGGDDATTTRTSGAPRPVVEPGSITVAVLNGTTTDGLAAALRDQVAAAGYRRGTIDVFSSQQLGESVVEYAPGHRAAAKAVGRVLAISRYGPVTADSRARAGEATVIVVAGADKAAAAAP